MKISRTVGVLLGALVLVGGANVAVYAATGGSFILGHKNSAGRPTVLTNTGQGHALVLHSKGAPLAVSNSKKVVNLNADMVDGKSASDLGTQTYVFSTPNVSATASNVGSMYVTFSTFPAGTYLVTYSVSVTGSGPVDCKFSGGTDFSLHSSGAASGGVATCDASGVVSVSQGLKFQLTSGTAWSTDCSDTQWTFTRIDSTVTTGTFTPSFG